VTTANKIIAQALGLIGVRSSADPVSGADAAIALERLNTLLDAWRVQSLFAYATQAITGALPANTATRTIGPTGDLVVDPRPMRIEAGSKYTVGGQDYPITPITQAQYESISLKTVGGMGPDVVFYNPTLPNGVLSFYPLSGNGCTLSLVALVQVSQFADLTTDYTLSPGYERALVFSLAEEVAPDFERDAPPVVVRGARNARRMIQRANHDVPQLDVANVPQSRLGQFLGG
jgi:hypothetical protein